VEPILGAILIVSFAGLASQTGFDSTTTAVLMSAGSSGEHETSLLSAVVSLGRVWVNAAEAKSRSAKHAIRVVGNSFRNAIDRELPFLPGFFLLVLYFEEKGASRNAEAS